MIRIKFDNKKILNIKEDITIKDLASLSEKKDLIVGGLVNNEVESLNYHFKEDCDFNFVYLNTFLGKKIYEKKGCYTKYICVFSISLFLKVV